MKSHTSFRIFLLLMVAYIIGMALTVWVTPTSPRYEVLVTEINMVWEPHVLGRYRTIYEAKAAAATIDPLQASVRIQEVK